MYSSSRTTDTQLKKWSKQLNIPLGAICYKNELMNVQVHPNTGYIINMANNDDGTHGTHWVALYFDRPDQAYYFDSFGIAMPIEVRDFAKKFGCNTITYSIADCQSLNSGGCGQYCLLFLSFMSRNLKVPPEKRYRLFLSQFLF